MIKVVIILAILILILFTIILILKNKLFKINVSYESLKKEYSVLKNNEEYKQRELDRMKNQIKVYEKNEDNIPIIKICNKKLKKNLIYKGKRALIGDCVDLSYRNTISILKSFGMTVDVVHKGTDIVDKIKHGYTCDIIFTNSIYKVGYNGFTTLNHLREIEGFDIPIVIHTISKNERHKFIDIYGFDEYVVKPLTQENTKPILDKFLSNREIK